MRRVSTISLLMLTLSIPGHAQQAADPAPAYIDPVNGLTLEDAIARALANDPPIIMADEPTGNLDSTTGQLIMQLLIDVRRMRQTTMLLVTHDAELASLADSRLVLRDGRPVDDGSRIPLDAAPGTPDPASRLEPAR